MTEDKINLLDPKQQEKLEKPLRKPKEFAMTRLSLRFDKSLKSEYVVDSEEKAIYLANDYLSDCPNECLMGIALDSEKHPICASILGIGGAHHIDKNYYNTFQFVFTSGADSFILIHNHPNSNSIKPSEADIETFKELGEISSKLGIKFRDFIITGNENQKRAYYSWNKEEIITQYEFLNHIEKTDIKTPIEVVDTSEKTIDEVNNLLAESKYNS